MAGNNFSAVDIPVKLFPLYFIEGEDDLLLKDCAGEIKSRFSEDSLSDFNYSRITAEKSTKASDINAVISELPMMADCRIVELLCFQKMTSEEKEHLAFYVKNGLGKTVLIIISNTGERSGRISEQQKKAENLIKAEGAFIDCRLTEKNWDQWIKKIVAKNSVSIESSAVALLKMRLGTDFAMTSLELKKLKAYAGDQRVITVKDVEEICSVSPSAQIYQITDFISKGNAGGAINAFYVLTGNEEPSLSLLAYLRKYFLGLASVYKTFKETNSVKETALILKKHEFVVKKSLETLSRVNDISFFRIAEILLNTDISFKSGHNRRLVFDSMIVRLSDIFR